jgi:hypothetical protein
MWWLDFKIHAPDLVSFIAFGGTAVILIAIIWDGLEQKWGKKR